MWEVRAVYLTIRGEVQSDGRLIVANAFFIDEELQGAWIREPAGGVIHVYLPYFGMLLNFVICYVSVWASHRDIVKG